jgi:hypothetical protein
MMDEEEGGNGIHASPYMSPMHMYGSAIITLTNPEDELYKLELTFRSARLDKDGEPQQYGEPLMNEHGISSIIGIVQGIVSRDAVLSNFNKTDIPALMDFLNDTLCRDLMINRVPYGIMSQSARDKIYFTAMSMAYITLKRGFEEGDKRFWKGSVQEIHSKIESPNQKKGILSALNPFK